MEPGGPLPPQPPELTARYNKKLLTLEEISQAHASSVYAQKYSIEVVGGKIKAVCKQPGQVQQPGMAHPPGQVQQPGMAHPPGQVQQPGMAHPPGQLQQPGMAHPPGQVQQPGMAHPPDQVQQLTTTYGAAMAELLSHDSPGTPANAEPTRLGFLLAPAATTAVPADAEEWVLEVSRDNPQWTLGVIDLLRERRAKGYWPVMPAAYVLDGVNFAPPKDKLNAPPQPPFGLLSPQEKEDAITTVVRLSKHLRLDLTDSQVKQAVQREVDVLQLGGWGDSELERFAALLAPKPPDAAGRVVVEQVSMRRAFWSKAGLRGFPLLAVAASRLLGVHATSAASERNWSAWGRLFTSARTRLTLERAKMLIYIKANAGLGARRSNEAQLLARMGE
ncbi:hypothetical protein QJQ45_002636 [Haematococcus lacustris]|nr:hypothetical protein QJQ45_002636 [Haematococcus lacustris]